MKSLIKVLFLFVFFASPALAGHYATFTSTEEVTINDLSVEVEGEKVQVVDFFKVDAAAPDAAFLNHPAGRRQLILLFDLLFPAPEQLLVARSEAMKLIQSSAKEDLIMVAGISSLGLKIFCAPTSDRNQIVAGLNALNKEKLEGMITGPEGNFYPAKFTPNSPVVQLTADEDFLGSLKSLGLDEKKKEDHSFIMVQGLVDLSYTLGALHGRKAVVFFSPGFETKGVSLNLDLDEKRGPARTSPSGGSDPASLDTITSSSRDIEALAQQGPARRPRQTGAEVIPELYAGVDAHIYVVNPAEEDNGFIKDLAQKTGALYWKKSFDTSQILAAEQKFYVVDWEDSKRKEFKTLNTFKLSAGEKKIIASNKWMSPRPTEEETPLEKRMHLAEAVYKDFGKFSTNDRFWVDFAFEQGFNKISSFIQIGSAELQKNGNDALRLEFYGYAMTRDGQVLDSNSLPLELDLNNDKLRERIAQSGIKVWNVLLGNEQPLIIRSIIVNSSTGETKTATHFLDVNETGLTMSSPFVPATDFSWIVWPKPEDEVTRRGVNIRYPYRQGSQQFFFPDLSPVFKPGAGVVYFRLYNILPESKNPAVHFQLLNSKGEATEVEVFHLMQKPNTLEHSGMELFWDLKTLPPVEPGAYRIKIGIQDPLRKQIVVREIHHLSIQSS